MNLKLSSRDVALMAIFAALSAIVVRVVPGIPIIGLSGASIKFDAALAPIYGMIIGPYLGFLAGLVGGLIVADSPFSVLTSFATAISAFVAGFFVQSVHASKGNRFHGWTIASTVVGLLILGWYATWVGRQLPFYPILHFSGLFIILVGRGKIAKAFEKGEKSGGSWQPKPYVLLFGILVFVLAYIFSKLYLIQVEIISYFSLPLYIVGGVAIVYGLLGSRVREKFVIAIVLASYCGIIADHMVGNLMFIQFADPFWGLSAEFVLLAFLEAAPISVVERLLFTTIATIVGVGLISSIRRAGLYSKRE
ncbi:MAG: ECF transporter S component [Candidatus Bathyarchaeia archaeon]